MELLTFCTETHGYRVKYLFGRQPIASYVDKMLRSKNKLFVIRKSQLCIAAHVTFNTHFIAVPLMKMLSSLYEHVSHALKPFFQDFWSKTNCSLQFLHR